ncbi:MAG: PaaI family thioesterase [Sphingomonadales bacterium]|nr:PaaI family thioesterase [Sphingomonadales bacterium]MDE2570618.1 PaaI family thioesterase [Sphingomonadales bacterium]
MGARAVSFDRETETLTMAFTVPDCFITPRGGVQGGLVAGFLDEAMGWVHVIATHRAEAPLMLDITLSLIRQVPPGELMCTARVVRRGRRVIFLESDLFDPQGTLLARATSTAIPTPVPGM